MVKSKRNKLYREKTAQTSSTPFMQGSVHAIHASLIKTIISDSVGAGISHDEAHGIIDAVLFDYDDHCYRQQQKSCLRTLGQSKSVGCRKVKFDLNVSVLEYDTTGDISAITDIESMANLLCHYMPEAITIKEAQSIVRTAVNQSCC